MSDTPRTMTRRDALKAVLAGGTLAAGGWLAGCAREDHEATALAPASAQEDQALLEDIADTLLPTTAASPGAKAAGVGAMMARLLADCESVDTQQQVRAGLQAFRQRCRERGGAFASLPASGRERLLREQDAAAQQAGPTHWFNRVRGLALQAYFTSETGQTKAMRYVPVPGRYDGCVPLEPGQPAWA